MNEFHRQQQSLKRIVAPNIRRRISPTMETHPTSEILAFCSNRAKLDPKGNALPGGLEQVNAACRDDASGWHILHPADKRPAMRRRVLQIVTKTQPAHSLRQKLATGWGMVQ